MSDTHSNSTLEKMNRHRQRTISMLLRTPKPLVLLVFLLSGQHPGYAKTFLLPPDNEALIGKIEETRIKDGDTLLDIARLNDLGLNEITAANPGVDPWLPEVNKTITVPNLFVLPDAPREGIVINLPEMRLYYYPQNTAGNPRRVITYPLGIGAEGRNIPLMTTTITAKKIKPSWQIPESIRAEHDAEGDILPRVMPPGPDNPLGDFSMRLGGSTYLIHGTNRPYSIGMRISHGCLRMYPEDIALLFPQIPINTPVRIVNQPYKAGWLNTTLYLESHPSLVESQISGRNNLTPMVKTIVDATIKQLNDLNWDAAMHVATYANGIPSAIYQLGRLKIPDNSLPEPISDR